ncbi:ATP-sensitive inward rectifier potassium channel 11-like [Saccostrea cucullata]|uniref:ATP-sensitive inward rectifier potassium channel 11-like n=1 Tax=Saccostrea cuccullata TaxID=36930 RepID=UPI002ED18B12
MKTLKTRMDSCVRSRTDSKSEMGDDKWRLVSKNGNYRVRLENVDTGILKNYIRDAFTTLLDAKWRWILLIFVMGFILTWTIFACFYLLFSYINGDTVDSYDHDPCITNVYDFTTAFLFSVETQHTIGYGSRASTPHCPHVVFLVFLQFIIGIGVQCLTAALVFTKLQRSKKRGDAIIFSQQACIGIVDGKWQLMVRVGDFRRSHLVDVIGKGKLIKRTPIPNTNQEFMDQVPIDFKAEGGGDVMTLLWPAVMYHTIDENSPLWPPENLHQFGDFSELIVTIEGVIESTSRAIQVRTSYLPDEIVMGYKFLSINPGIDDDGKYHCSYFDISTLCPIMQNTPRGKRRFEYINEQYM